MTTVRQQLIALLCEDTYDARELSQSVGIREKEVYEHIPHIERSLGPQGKKLETIAPHCIACGFSFKKREKAGRPSRCPKCKSERIGNPRYRIR